MAATQANHETVAIDGQLTDREVRALTTPMTVIDDCGVVRDADGMYEITTDSGRSYIVDMHGDNSPRCSCKDYQFRGGSCKHIERVRFETGEKAIPAWVDLDELDDQLGLHISEGEPRIAIADGGTEVLRREATGGREDLDVEAVDGGHLVWDVDGRGRSLAGFADVDDWDAVRSEVARRGLGVGAIHHLDEFDLEEVR